MNGSKARAASSVAGGTPTGLGENARKDVGGALEALLADMWLRFWIPRRDSSCRPPLKSPINKRRTSSVRSSPRAAATRRRCSSIGQWGRW